jgi:hypothetical protein
MTQGAFALAGVFVGAVLKSLFDLLIENRRWRREDRQYFKDKRLEAYISLVASAQEMVMMSWELYEERKDNEYSALMHKFLSDYQTVYILHLHLFATSPMGSSKPCSKARP